MPTPKNKKTKEELSIAMKTEQELDAIFDSQAKQAWHRHAVLKELVNNHEASAKEKTEKNGLNAHAMEKVKQFWAENNSEEIH